MPSTNGGSSPQAWGTRTPGQPWLFPCRFIPTGVGNTPEKVAPGSGHSVHPHRRGEHRPWHEAHRRVVGSSPQAWGTPRPDAMRSCLHRFIPTGVGNTPPAVKLPQLVAVHPHRRGEHGGRLRRSDRRGGSSPQAWGTRRLCECCFLSLRFIPTGVGNTPIAQWYHFEPAVHPHRRGEHGARLRERARQGGSSPQAWGTLAAQLFHGHGARFIPTGVGNTHSALAKSHWCPVHPHRRGEHAQRPVISCSAIGSSPQAWGTRRECNRGCWGNRFIPTGVGNTTDLVTCTAGNPVHPHRRGEHVGNSKCTSDTSGSSPQAWGTHYAEVNGMAVTRFIPTGVGNTWIGQHSRMP